MKKILPFVLLLLAVVCVSAQERPPQKEVSESRKEIKINQTAGDLIIKSSKLKLAGYTVSVGTSILYAAGAFKEMKEDEKNTIVIASGVAGLSLYIAGELTLIKAGKMLNQEKITLSPATKGIGLAINF